MHGHFKGEVKGDKSGLYINGRKVHVFAEKQPKASLERTAAACALHPATVAKVCKQPAHVLYLRRPDQHMCSMGVTPQSLCRTSHGARQAQSMCASPQACSQSARRRLPTWRAAPRR